MTEGIEEALSHDEARVLLEKRKEISSPDELSSRAEPATKKRKKVKAKTAEPTLEIPIVFEDENEDEVSSECIEAIYDDVPIQ